MSTDTARFLADSPDRIQLLERIRDSPGGPRDFADALGQSRRSVQRNLAAFEERGWVERRDGTVHLTTKGDVVATEFRRHLDVLETVSSSDEFYRHVPTGAAPPPTLIADVTVVTADSEHPQAPVSHYVSAVSDAQTDRFRMLSPVLSRIFHEAHAERVLDGVRTELILDESTVAAARERNPGEFSAVLAVPTFTLYRHDGPVEFGVTLADDRALLLAYDADGQLRACADGDDPAFLSWATEVYDRHRSAAEKVSVADGFRS